MMAESERERESGNFCCVLNCLAQNDSHLLAKMLSELLGREVSDGECVNGSKLSWHVINKYYTAEVILYIHKTAKEALDSKRQYEGLLMLCNLGQSDVVEVVSKKWEELEDHMTPGVCLLVGLMDGDGKETEANQQELLGWCVQNNFELIEWEKNASASSPANQEDSDDDDGLPPDPVGISRVSDALQAHMWPNMELRKKQGQKDGDSDRTEQQAGNGLESSDKVAASGGEAEREGEKVEDTIKGASREDLEAKAAASLTAGNKEARSKVDSLLSEEERLIAEGLDGDKDPGGESFESLFARFSQMKQHAQSLPHEERKEYAEKVVMAFWNAIGGDEDEIKQPDNKN